MEGKALKISDVHKLIEISKDPPSFDKLYVEQELSIEAQAIGLGLLNLPHHGDDADETLIQNFKNWAKAERKKNERN